MQKPTATDTAFLAGTLAVAAASTIAIVPGIVDEIKEQSDTVAQELRENNQADPKDVFAAGVVVGIGLGAAGTIKVISDKM